MFGGVRFGAVGEDIYLVEYFVVIFGWLVVMVAMRQSFAAHIGEANKQRMATRTSPGTINIKHPGILFHLH